MSKIPVLIAARNETSRIGSCLAALDRRYTAPYVIANDSHDTTAQIAKVAGAKVLETDTPGKLHALQLALHSLGSGALGPVLYTDADTQPLFPSTWPHAMARGLGDKTVGSGLFVSYTGAPLERVAMSALRLANAFGKIATKDVFCSGGNMITHLKTPANLQRILELDPASETPEDLERTLCFAPNERRAILSPLAVVKTSSEHLPSAARVLLLGRTATIDAARKNRTARGI